MMDSGLVGYALYLIKMKHFDKNLVIEELGSPFWKHQDAYYNTEVTQD